MGAGDYFFAVLEPGGQGGDDNPNDGTPKNLSFSIGGAYTARTFHIDDNGAVTYAMPPGTHDFDAVNGQIRVAPFTKQTITAESTSLRFAGLPSQSVIDAAVNKPGAVPSDCKYDAFKVNTETPAPPFADPTVSKDAALNYDNSYSWHFAKAVDQTLVKQVGGNVTFNYTVTVNHDAAVSSNVTYHRHHHRVQRK